MKTCYNDCSIQSLQQVVIHRALSGKLFTALDREVFKTSKKVWHHRIQVAFDSSSFLALCHCGLHFQLAQKMLSKGIEERAGWRQNTMERGEGHKNTAKIGSKLKSPPEAEELRSPLSVFSPNSAALRPIGRKRRHQRGSVYGRQG